MIGSKGLKADDLKTVRPTDVVADLRFEPTVGRKLVQKAFQNQQLVNWWDRAVQMNMAGAQMGTGEMFDLNEMAQRIFRDGFGIVDTHNLILDKGDAESLRTVTEEHRLFAMGEKLDPQPGEKTYLHISGHIQFLQEGGADAWSPPNRRALIEHIYSTVDEFYREVEAALPGTGDIIAAQVTQQLQAAGLESERGEKGYGAPDPVQQMQQQMQQQMMAQQAAAGGRGIAGPGQSPQSPNFRGPASGEAQSASMGAAPNTGAQ